jgi:hypothetical protein
MRCHRLARPDRTLYVVRAFRTVGLAI